VGWYASLSNDYGVSGGFGVGITFMPTPDANVPSGICGGFGAAASLCFSTQSDEEKCKKKKMKYCMMAQCTDEYLNSGCGSDGDGTGAINITQMPGYGNTDPLPEDVNPTPPDDDDPCDSLAPYIGGKPSKECCDEKPNHPGCGDPIDINPNTLVSNPGIQSPTIDQNVGRNLRRPN